MIRLRVFRSPALEDDKHTQVLVRAEAMIGAGLDEDGRAFRHGNLLAFDLKDACALEDDVELVVIVGLLSVGLRGYETVDTDFEAGGLVDDLVPTAGVMEPLLDSCDFEWMHGSNYLTRTVSRST